MRAKPRHTRGEWLAGYGRGITGPTAPAVGGVTVAEQLSGKQRHTVVRVVDMPDDLGSCVAIIPLRSRAPERDANARLIAAAPELLVVCKMLAGLRRTTDSESCEEMVALFPEQSEALDAAIGKAEGTGVDYKTHNT